MNIEKIVNGVFYSTNTATLIAEKEGKGFVEYASYVYKTQKSNYFKVTIITFLNLEECISEDRRVLEPISKEEAMRFYENNIPRTTYLQAFDVEVEIG